MEDKYWYNIKETDGSISIEKKLKEKEEKKETDYSIPENKKRNSKPLFILLLLLIIVPLIVLLLLNNTSDRVIGNSKYRTFMIYMVGSDLETGGKVASYDLNDIKGTNIDLDNNNVLLMVGGAKKWHNFVSEDEVGLYELSKTGFKKIKTYKLSSMGSSKNLQEFIEFTTDHYKSEKYDMIFWNHGLAAAGLELDEVFDDYLDINELDEVFSKTMFKENKLELVIFNNCMSGNIHIASIMKKYANYMVASEEVMYVGSIIDRLNFLNNVKKTDKGYDIGLSYIKKSDESIKTAGTHNKMKLESTLSIIDLSKIDEVEKNMNDFFKSIDLENNYKAISRARRKTTTYGEDDITFDTVDLYSLTNYLKNFSNEDLKNKLQESINNAVVYNSASNDYSKGLSVYFPYYGSTELISSHLYLFEKLWNNDYLDFINRYSDLSLRAKRANRAGQEGNILHLKNNIKYENNQIIVELTDEEMDKYQDANIYVFEKDNNNYKLLLKSDEVELNSNRLVANELLFLKTSNNKIISSIKENDTYRIYGKLNDSDVIVKVDNNQGFGNITKILVDSNDKPHGGLVDFNDELISYYSLYYNNMGTILDEDWNTDINKEELNNNSNEINIVDNNLSNYFIMLEMHDDNNDVFYSNIMEIK